MNENEIWKDIVGYEGLYQVSNLGRVKSLNYLRTGKEKIMNSLRDSNGYLSICLSKGGIQKRYRIHRVVYESFFGSIPVGLVINHIDENITNNRLTNLEAITPIENYLYGTRLQRISKSLTNNPSRSKTIIQIDIETNEIINKFPSIREASRQTGFSSGNISMCAKGNYKTAHGYTWKYK